MHVSTMDYSHIFAYGSLIWRPDFNYLYKKQVAVQGYERRFWQASHDHRGTPEHPGRVVTLVSAKLAQCEGVIYALPINGRENILAMLDEREQDGYERVWVNAVDVQSGRSYKALTWIATESNPSWAGQESLENTASLIAHRQGPSGTNRDYLFQLDHALKELGVRDRHIEDLVALVRLSK